MTTSVLASYSFTLANQNGWPANSEGSWSQKRGAAVQAIASNKGTITGDVGTFNIFTFTTQTARDVELLYHFIPENTGDLIGLVARYQNGNYYYADIGDGGQLIEIGKYNGSFNTLKTASFSFSAGNGYWIKFHCEMAELAVKCWQDTGSEPADYNLTLSDPQFVSSGLFGIGTALGSSGSIRVDTFSATAVSFNYAPVISRNVGAYTNDNNSGANPEYFANNFTYSDMWRTGATPSSGSPLYLAYDLSPIPAANRGSVLLAWYNDPETDQYDPAEISQTYNNTPQNYTIDANAAAGGSLPGSGWVTLVTVTNNNFHSRQHAVNLTGYNWVRMNVTASQGVVGNQGAACNIDVHDLSVRSLDDWIFYGDSITARGFDHSDTTLAASINASRAGIFPVMEDGGSGGLTSTDGANNISTWLGITSAHYIGVLFGTNDANNASVGDPNFATTFYNNMVTMVTAIIAAGAVPVVPTVMWGSTTNLATNVPLLNAKLTTLYAAYPQVKRGPDLYSYFSQNQSLIGGDGIHPTDPAGYSGYRSQWLNWALASVYPSGTPAIYLVHRKKSKVRVA